MCRYVVIYIKIDESLPLDKQNIRILIEKDTTHRDT